MARTLRALIILALIGALALVGAIFVFWLPPFREYLITLEGNLPILSSLVYPISALVATLCIASLAIALAFPSAMKRDMIFSTPTSSKLSIISLLISISGSLILVSAVTLLSVGDRLLSFPMIIISSIILLIAFMLSILSSYVKRAAELKEEVDATL